MISPALVEDTCRKIREACGKSEGNLPLTEPSFQGNEWTYVKECLDTGWVSSVGSYVDLFEKKLAEYTGARFCVATTNGTSALHIALLLAGTQPDDEVLVPALTFVAAANAVTYTRAVPHFVDVSQETLGMDPDKLDAYLKTILISKDGASVNKKTGRRISAAVVVHAFGHAADLDELVIVLQKYGIVLVEDAAESMGSLYRGVHTGLFGRVSALSFNGNKIITTGGGGAILTNDAELATRAKHLTTTAKRPHAWEFFHDEIGYNYRLPNLNAAVGCAQLEKLNLLVAAKRALSERYRHLLEGFELGNVFIEPALRRSNYWLNTFILKERYALDQEELLNALQSKAILARPAWRLPSGLPIYASSPRSGLSVAQGLERRIVNFPSVVHL